MNKTQKVLLAVYLPVTALILILDRYMPAAVPVYYFKFAAITSLFITATFIKKTCRPQVLLNLSLFFIVIADFFLVFAETIPSLKGHTFLLGMGGFMAAYLLLIAVFRKHSKTGPCRPVAAFPVLTVFLPVFAVLVQHINGLMLWAALLFSAVLCVMAWSAIATLCSGCYSPKASRLMAAAGFLAFICDMGVALAHFHPLFAGRFVPWLENIIWAAYVPAWTLIVLLIAEKGSFYRNPPRTT